MPAGRGLILLLKKNEIAQSVAIAIAVAGLLIGLVVLFLAWPVDEFRAIAIVNYSKINYDRITCLSILSQRVTIEGKPYSDPALPKSIADILSIKPILHDATYSECPWFFSAHILPGRFFKVFDGILPAQYVVSVSICEQIDDRRMNLSNCLSKSVYVFNWRVDPRDLFRIGLVGLKPETKDEKEFRVKAHDD